MAAEFDIAEAGRQGRTAGGPVRIPDDGADSRRGADGGGGLDLRFLFGVLRRRKYMVAGLIFFITGCAAVYVGQLTPLYRAEAQIVLQPDRRNIMPLQKVVGDLPVDWQTAQTEAAVIASRELARQAVQRLDLAESELFNPRQAPESEDSFAPLQRAKAMVRQLVSTVRVWLSDIGVETAPKAHGVEGSAPARRPASWRQETEDGVPPFLQYLTSRYLSGLSVFASDRSRVISVRYTSVDPQFAAVAANTTARLYIQSQRTEKKNVTDEASDWLRTRVDEVREKLLESQQQLHEFRRQGGLSESSGPSLPAQRLSQLNSQLVDARARLAEARARYKQVQQLLKDSGAIDTAAAVLDSNLIEQLRIQEIKLNRRVAELESQYRDSHPKMANARAELKDLQQRIKAEVDKIAGNLRNELEVAQVRVDNLESEIAKLQNEVEDLNAAEVKLQTLKSNVEANKQLYQTLLQRLKETKVQEGRVQSPDARLISEAQPPAAPFYPNTKIFVAMAFIVSAGLAAALALLLEYLDAGYRSLTQLERQIGLVTFGIIPKVKLRRGERPHGTLALRKGSVFAEAIRTVRTGLQLAHADRPPRIVMVTSSIPDEAKTSTTLSLAAQTVQAGRRCIVIDCDLRVANLGDYLNWSDRVGLSDFLYGNARLDEIIEVDPASGVHFVTAGSRVQHPDELLGSATMRRLTQALANEYQIVLLDTPPVMAVADALILAGGVDAVIYLVRWGKTRREWVQRGVQRLVEAGAPFVGAALTCVDVRKHAQHDYADAGQYYGAAYRKYYAGG